MSETAIKIVNGETAFASALEIDLTNANRLRSREYKIAKHKQSSVIIDSVSTGAPLFIEWKMDFDLLADSGLPCWAIDYTSIALYLFFVCGERTIFPLSNAHSTTVSVWCKW